MTNRQRGRRVKSLNVIKMLCCILETCTLLFFLDVFFKLSFLLSTTFQKDACNLDSDLYNFTDGKLIYCSYFQETLLRWLRYKIKVLQFNGLDTFIGMHLKQSRNWPLNMPGRCQLSSADHKEDHLVI